MHTDCSRESRHQSSGRHVLGFVIRGPSRSQLVVVLPILFAPCGTHAAADMLVGSCTPVVIVVDVLAGRCPRWWWSLLVVLSLAAAAVIACHRPRSLL
jgi:hypothetical protein